MWGFDSTENIPTGCGSDVLITPRTLKQHSTSRSLICFLQMFGFVHNHRQMFYQPELRLIVHSGPGSLCTCTSTASVWSPAAFLCFISGIRGIQGILGIPGIPGTRSGRTAGRRRPGSRPGGRASRWAAGARQAGGCQKEQKGPYPYPLQLTKVYKTIYKTVYKTV